MIKVKNIRIAGVGPIKDLELDFNDHFNIVCGQNGIGKTTILDAISQAFSLKDTNLKRNANCTEGSITLNVSIDGKIQSKSISVDTFEPSVARRSGQGLYQLAKDIIVFKTHRDIPYSKLASLATDPLKDEQQNARQTVTGALSSELKNWFVNRHLWSKHEDHLDEGQLRNIELAKNTISTLNSTMSFSRVDPRTNDILINTHDGEIFFEYLSSGYKSCLAVLMGIIKEIEFRYHTPSIFVSDFEGMVFIDEIDLHLHPEWQAKIYLALKNILPKAQIFTSTHSPHLIQVAEPAEIIALVKDEDFNTIKNETVNIGYGCQGWTVEEVLRDVMGLSETRTENFNSTMEHFTTSLDNGDCEAARTVYEEICLMLHPDSPFRKIMEIQMVGIGEND